MGPPFDSRRGAGRLSRLPRVSIPGFKAATATVVVYTPLNGTGMEQVTRILARLASMTLFQET